MSYCPPSAGSAASSSAAGASAAAAAASSSSSSSSAGSLFLHTALDADTHPQALHAASQLSSFIQRVQEEGFNTCLSHYTNHVELLAIANTSVIVEQSLRTGCYLVQAMILVHVWLLQKKMLQGNDHQQAATTTVQTAAAAAAAAAIEAVVAPSTVLTSPPTSTLLQPLATINESHPSIDLELDSLLQKHRTDIQCSVALFYHGPRSQNQRPSQTVLWKATFAVQLYLLRNHPLFQSQLQSVIQRVCISKLELLHPFFHSLHLDSFVNILRLCQHIHISNQAVSAALANPEVKDCLKQFHTHDQVSVSEWTRIDQQLHYAFVVTCLQATVATKQKSLQDYVDSYKRFMRMESKQSSAAASMDDGTLSHLPTPPSSSIPMIHDSISLFSVEPPACSMEDAQQAIDDKFMDDRPISKHRRSAEGVPSSSSTHRRRSQTFSSSSNRRNHRLRKEREEDQEDDRNDENEDANTSSHVKRSRLTPTESNACLRFVIDDLKAILDSTRQKLHVAEAAIQTAHSSAFRRAILEQITGVEQRITNSLDGEIAEEVDREKEVTMSENQPTNSLSAASASPAAAAASLPPSSSFVSVVGVSLPLTLSNRWVVDCLPLLSHSEPGSYASVGVGTLVQMNSHTTNDTTHSISSLRVYPSVQKLLKSSGASSSMCSLPVRQCLYKQCYAICRKHRNYLDISHLAVEMAVLEHLQQDSTCPYLPKVFGMGNMIDVMKPQFVGNEFSKSKKGNASPPALSFGEDVTPAAAQIASLPDVAYHTIHSVMLMEWVRGLTLWTLLHTLPEGRQALKDNVMTSSQEEDLISLQESIKLYDDHIPPIILDKSNHHTIYPPRLRWCLQLARGMKFLHRCGIIHRDIKPNNILFTSPRIYTWMRKYHKLQGMRPLTDTMGGEIHELPLSIPSSAEADRSLQVDGFGWGHALPEPKTVDHDVWGARLVIVDFNGSLLFKDCFASKSECHRNPHDWVGGTEEYRETWWMEYLHQQSSSSSAKSGWKQLLPQALRDEAWTSFDQFAVGLVMLDLLRGVAASASNSESHRKYFTRYWKERNSKENNKKHVPSVSEYLLLAELREEDWTPQFLKANEDLRVWMFESAAISLRVMFHCMTRIRWSLAYEEEMKESYVLTEVASVPTMVQVESTLMTEMTKSNNTSAVEHE